MYWAFQDIRGKSNADYVEYPEVYYEVVYKSIVELAQQRQKKLSYLEYRTAGGIWLLGEMQGSKISEKTFNWLWNNLKVAFEYEQDDMVVYYWQNSHRYLSYNLHK